MRKLVVTEFVSLDGVMEGPGGDDGYVHGPWTMPYWCDEVAAYKSAELGTTDMLLLGRRTYEGFAAAWPERSGDPFSDKFNAMPKHVISTTLQDPSWNNTTVHADISAVSELKAGDGGDIAVHGSSTLVRSLLEADLVDELHLAIYPVTLGSGLKLFPDESRLDFRPDSVTTTPTGVLLTVYSRVEGPNPHEFDWASMQETLNEQAEGQGEGEA